MWDPPTATNHIKVEKYSPLAEKQIPTRISFTARTIDQARLPLSFPLPLIISTHFHSLSGLIRFSLCLSRSAETKPSSISFSLIPCSFNSMASLHNEITNAFEEIASTSSSTPKKAPYDVFINHRGIDVKKTLASSIYHSLDRMGIRVFLDTEELEQGDDIQAEIQDAIRTSFLHIAIFSRNYAQSPWCLAELSFILKTGTRIIPVLYDVGPSDLRWAAKGKGIYADAFSQYEAKNIYTPEKLEEWKMALRQVSLYSGYILKKDDDEGMMLKSIVNCVIRALKLMPLEVARHPVGLQESVQDFERHAYQSSKNVQIIGIVGMGGSGKTTLAKELYSKKSSFIARCSFLFDVREAASQNRLHIKQKTLLVDLKLEHSPFDNVEKGMEILASCLGSGCFLIVLDDVDHPDQLDALLPVKDSLASGSSIIVTSRDKGVLESWGISCIYNMKQLDRDHARQLLCWHAFLQPYPLEGFERLVEEFVDFCNGLPLSLEVLGRHLYSRSVQYWESQLYKISRRLPNDIKETPQVTYDKLDEEEKEIFLDIACFFIGQDKNLATSVWDGCGWSGVHSWETLLNKCLVELDEGNCIKMHDQLRDLGREIARRQLPYRLWLPEQITHIQEQAKERVLIRGIKAETSEFHQTSSHYQTPFEECMELVRSSGREFNIPGQLKLLIVRGNFFKEEFATVSTGLVWLRWVDFQQGTLPSWLSLKNLSVLELLEAKNLQELWRDNDDPPSELRELIITGGWRFVSFPTSMGRLKHLKKIVLKKINLHGNPNKDNSVPLRGLPEEFCLLQSLEHLTLEQCTSLTSLPSRFGNLKNLRHLDLSGCNKLMMLPVSCKQLIHLEYINLAHCSELTFTSENADIVKNMTKLEMLNFRGCSKLQELPSLTNQRWSLRELDVSWVSLWELPSNIGELSKLEVLRIGSDFLTSLPTSLGNLSSLTHLEICWCSDLKSLPTSLGKLSSLTLLKIYRCGQLESLPDSLANLTSLTSLYITYCSIKSLPVSVGDLCSLRSLAICDCSMLESLPESMGNLKLLQRLEITGTRIKALPKTLAQLSNLQHLHILSCPIKELDFCPIKELNFELGSFSSLLYKLKFIYLAGTDVSQISISEHCCPSLETLYLQYNNDLIDIQMLPISLTAVTLTRCKMLKNISGICGLLRLQKLIIKDCGKLDELPSFAELTSLETLRAVDTTWKVAAVQSWERMERLRTLELKACDISAIEPCLQTIKKWPSETIVCGRTEDDVDSIEDFFTFTSDFTLVDSCLLHQKIADGCWGSVARLKGGQRRSSNAAAMVCFIIDSFSENIEVSLTKEFGECITSSLWVEKGKWVWISVFTDASSWFMAEEYNLYMWDVDVDEDVNVDVDVHVGGMLVMGEQEKVVEGFYKLLAHLRKPREQITNSQKQIEERLPIRGMKAETSEFHEDSTTSCLSHETSLRECMELVGSAGRPTSLNGLELLLVTDKNLTRKSEDMQERVLIRGFKAEKAMSPPFQECMELVRNDYLATVSTVPVWLRWVDFQEKTLPSWLSLKNLRVLELLKANDVEELWSDNVDPPFQLERLALPECTSLTSLPSRFGDLTNLRHLDLYRCNKLKMLPVSFKQLIHLEYINLAYCGELTFTSDNADILENMTKLEMLSFFCCSKLQDLPLLTNQRSLRELDVTWMESLRELPSNIGELSKLEELRIGSYLLRRLPPSLGNLSSLRSLKISWCSALESLPDSIGNLSSLTSLQISWCSKLKSLPDFIGKLSSLSILQIDTCEKLESFPDSIGNLSSLTSLQISSNDKLKCLPDSIGKLSSLATLQICYCQKLVSLPESIGDLNLLQHLEIMCTDIKSLPKAIGQLSSLQSLQIYSCPIKELNLESGSFSSLLVNLHFIALRQTHVSRISISQKCCPSLKTLQLEYNDHLIDIRTLPISLQVITLINCKMLKSISGICGLSKLQKLVIEDCGELDELPSFAELVSLETLRAHTLWKVAAIQSWKHMERLRTVELRACNTSAIEPCLRTIQKWPSKTIICARAVCDVDLLVNSFAFSSDLTLVHNCVPEKTPDGRRSIARLKSGQRRSSKAAMVCFLINSPFENIEVYLTTENGEYSRSMWVEKGKWVWIGVFTHASSLTAEYNLNMYVDDVDFDGDGNVHDDVEVGGMLVMGEHERVVESFYKLLAHLGKSIE